MAETKDFTCGACGAQFDSRDKLDQHKRREHGTQAQGSQPDEGFGEGTQRAGQNEPRDKRASGLSGLWSGNEAG